MLARQAGRVVDLVNVEPSNGSGGTGEASAGLAALTSVRFDGLDVQQILASASAAVANLASLRVEGSYLSVEGELVRQPSSDPSQPDTDDQLWVSGVDAPVAIPDERWAWAYALRHQGLVLGALIVSAAAQPETDALLLLTLLAGQTGAALGFYMLQQREAQHADELAAAVDRLQKQSTVRETVDGVMAAGSGEQGIADALHAITALPVSVEDRFGNLRSWAGPGRPLAYPMSDPPQREALLHRLATHGGAIRLRDRTAILIQPRTEVLGVLSLIGLAELVSDDQLFALRHASMVLGLELSHQHNLAEMDVNLRRELVDDLVAGTDEDGAYSRAGALGHDLHGPHYVVVVHCPGADSALAAAAGRAATALHMDYMMGRHAGLVVLITSGRPEPDALYREVSRQWGKPACAIGIGSRCESPRECPESFDTARRALHVRLHSAQPAGASAYDELGFYHLVDTADPSAVEDFIREWLGLLIDYDGSKNSDLVQTLSEYLDCGGNYDESAAALRIHRSTLRYRLSRIAELTGHDLRNVDTRFNLHAATRAWRFFRPDG